MSKRSFDNFEADIPPQKIFRYEHEPMSTTAEILLDSMEDKYMNKVDPTYSRHLRTKPSTGKYRQPYKQSTASLKSRAALQQAYNTVRLQREAARVDELFEKAEKAIKAAKNAAADAARPTRPIRPLQTAQQVLAARKQKQKKASGTRLYIADFNKKIYNKNVGKSTENIDPAFFTKLLPKLSPWEMFKINSLVHK